MKCVVTGGGGFVGSALVMRLLEQGHEVVAIGRREYPRLLAAGARTVKADIGEGGAEFRSAFDGAAAVFHTAAKVEMWGPTSEFLRTNIAGTENVIAACRAAGVRRLIFTSSPSVIADGSDLIGVDESYPYPERYSAEYARTKAVAEQRVLEADSDILRTIALRPHLIFGPGDTNLIPAILERARAGRLVQVGSGSNLADFTFIDDCVAAHLLALDALERNPRSHGRAFFISQGQPVPLWGFINRVLELCNLEPVGRRIPKRLAMMIAALSETHAAFTGRKPLMTRFLVSEMGTTHYFSIDAARRELGYAPSRSVFEALDLTFRDGMPALYAANGAA